MLLNWIGAMVGTFASGYLLAELIMVGGTLTLHLLLFNAAFAVMNTWLYFKLK